MVGVPAVTTPWCHGGRCQDLLRPVPVEAISAKAALVMGDLLEYHRPAVVG